MREKSNLAFYDKFHNDEIIFNDSDGGRMATGKYKQRHVGDCVTRAIAHLLYYQVSDVLENAERCHWLENWWKEVQEGCLTTSTCYNTAYHDASPFLIAILSSSATSRSSSHPPASARYRLILNVINRLCASTLLRSSL